MYILPLQNETILLQHLARGDESAFERIFTYYWDGVYSTALRFVKKASPFLKPVPPWQEGYKAIKTNKTT